MLHLIDNLLAFLNLLEKEFSHSVLAPASWSAVSQTALWDVAIRTTFGIPVPIALIWRNKAPCDGALQDAVAPTPTL
jgi:hypothetical protein